MHFFHVSAPYDLLLPEEESLHATKVLRLQAGDEITLLDGKGGLYRAEITLPHAKRCGYNIITEQQSGTGRHYQLHVAIAPTKNMERLEWFVEKAVEIGVDEITPIVCRYSERKQVKPERLEKILLSACKQSVQVVFPLLHSQTSFEEFIKSAKAECKAIAHCYPEAKEDFRNLSATSGNILILIGPEGDFSPDEVKLAKEHGFKAVSLGDSRLRTETAGIMACAAALYSH